MVDTGIPSTGIPSTESQSSRPLTQRDIRVVQPRSPPPDPTHAFGFVLDSQSRRRWAGHFIEAADKEQPPSSPYTPQEHEDLLEGIMFAINTALPSRVYCALPDLPRVRRDLLPVDDGAFAYTRFVFALRDNSTEERLYAPVTPEYVDAVRKELGLGDDQRPRWFPIALCVQRARAFSHNSSRANLLMMYQGLIDGEVCYSSGRTQAHYSASTECMHIGELETTRVTTHAPWLNHTKRLCLRHSNGHLAELQT